MTATGFLLPDVENEDGAPFWAGTARGELLVQACGECGKWRFPPRPMCPHCRSTATRWEPAAGTATIWGFVVPHPPLLPAYGELAPYNVIVVALDEDPTIRMVGNLLASPDGAINEIDPETIQIGEPVRVVYQAVDDVTLPRWVRA
ncbi:MAG: zinc ribbon domain-containing protein [Acidimicrobiia bacterium]